MRRAAMLWTGGKDCALALHGAWLDGFEVSCLVTFAPPNPHFLAHPQAFIQMQAQSLALPHHLLTIAEPFAAGYENALRKLRDDGIDTVITGDIAEVGGRPNWIRERSRPVGLHVHTPLWGLDRLALLQRNLSLGFRIIFSCVDTRFLPADWVGRELNGSAVAELLEIRSRTGLDLCGEEGEYHTLVTTGPLFAQQIAIRSFTTGIKGFLAHIELHRFERLSQGSAECVGIRH